MVKDVAHLNLLPTFQTNISNIQPDFMNKLLALNPIIANPEQDGSWGLYNSFLDTFGDHVITSITFGASFNIWQSTDSETDDVTSYLKIKACVSASVGGSGSSDPKGSGCADYSSSARSRAESINSKFRFYIGGGSSVIRDQILDAYRYNPPRLPEGIVLEFLESATVEGNTKPIQFTFTPIWDLITSIIFSQYLDEIVYGRLKTPTPFSYTNPTTGVKKSYSDTDIAQICVNLQAAFVRNKVGCGELGRDAGAIYQQFRATPSGSGLTYYNCWAKKEGCNNSDRDCHYDSAAVGCKCYGGTAIERGDEFMKIPGFSTQYRSRPRGGASGGKYDGINNSCNYDGGWFHCGCDSNWSGGLPDRNIWSSINQ